MSECRVLVLSATDVPLITDRSPPREGRWLQDRGLTLGSQDPLQPKHESVYKTPPAPKCACIHFSGDRIHNFHHISKGLCV